MILLFLLSFIVRLGAAADPNYISINCGAPAQATAFGGRKWGGDAATGGSSTAAAVEGEVIASVDPVPYSTARISRSNFSYTFHLKPGQKSIRLHFNPVSYRGFESFNDFFTVESGPFTLLANFSASVTARALSRSIIVKEFCINVKENETLNLGFCPETSQWKSTYAFINGIDIISIPPMFAEMEVPLLGQNSVFSVDSSTALERVHYQHIKWGSVSSSDDVGGMFGMWAESSLKGNGKRDNNKSWRVSVDVGFMYLVRLHLCEVELEMDFVLLINNIVCFTNGDMRQRRGNGNILWYNNYMVMVGGEEQEDEHDISISLHSQHDFSDRHGPLEGFEVFKLSNDDRTLASPSLQFQREKSPPQTLKTLLHPLRALLYDLHGSKSLWGYSFFLNMCILVIFTSLERQKSKDNFGKKDDKSLTRKKDNKPMAWKEDNKPLAWKQQLCRRFSLAEIKAATENFNERFVLGKDGFGKFYRGFMDNGREIVTIKRIKTDHKQEERGFWTEIKKLCELRHVNLVSLIGYCREPNEKLLVYEYFPGGTLADRIFKLSKKNNDFHPLSWKQRLKICIGVGRALDYLHMGCNIIYRDFKPSNILLDENFLPKVSDFSLVKCGSGGEYLSQDGENLRLTFGYVDLTYWETHELTERSNIYSFGVLLLEVLCGRPAPPWNEQDKDSLITWKGQVDQLVDPSLRGEISPDSLKTFMKVAEESLHNEPKKRPDIGRVVAKLELALLQQEKGESVAPNERISVEDVVSCTHKSREDNMNLAKPNDNMNVENDASPRSSLGEQRGRNWFCILLSGMWEVKWALEEKSHDKATRGFQYAATKLNSGSMQGFSEWQAEVNFLGGPSHPNLGKLLGYCWEDKEQALHEMMPKPRGSPFQPLHWDIRLKTMIGIARGHALLHAPNARVTHRDFKASNILLDTSFAVKLCDFGLARLLIETHDYLASEYVITGRSYDLVWSLMEIRLPPGQHDYLERMKTYLCKRRRMVVMVLDYMALKGTYPSLSAPPLPLLVFNRLEGEPKPKNRLSMQEMVDSPEIISSGDNERLRVYFGD